MKALSLRQPWPWFILHAGKDVENREWGASYRGEVLIHSSKWWNAEEIGDDFDFAMRIARQAGTAPQEVPRGIDELKPERGHIVGVARIVGCVSHNESPWFFGPKAFLIKEPLAFATPILCKGERGLFEVPEDVAATCREEVRKIASHRLVTA